MKHSKLEKFDLAFNFFLHGDVEMVASQIINELEAKAMSLPLSEQDKKRYYDLANLPDEIVVPFDTRQTDRLLDDPTQKRINLPDKIEN